MASERGNEGEGSRTAAEGYERGVKETVRKGGVEEAAERARRDVEADPETFQRAEDEGKARSAGDLDADLSR
jgi:hypothetical protein